MTPKDPAQRKEAVCNPHINTKLSGVVAICCARHVLAAGPCLGLDKAKHFMFVWCHCPLCHQLQPLSLSEMLPNRHAHLLPVA